MSKFCAYYNEIDPFAAAWLRELIKEGAIAPGEVDERSIEDVVPDDIRSFTQCHFFAGIGGWSLALRLAGWPDDRPIFTGSCPCQPFSTAGSRKGLADERHLWPAFFWHIQQCRPSVVVGEQVASADALRWWDTVATDLEDADYSCAAIDLCAASVGAFHVRQRLYWVANANSAGLKPIVAGREPTGDMAHSDGDGRGTRRIAKTGIDVCQQREAGQRRKSRQCPDPRGATICMAYSNSERLQKQRQRIAVPQKQFAAERPSFWSDAEWTPCADGKLRATQPGIRPLAHGIPNRVGTLRGAGNAIVPQVAAEFIKALTSSPP